MRGGRSRGRRYSGTRFGGKKKPGRYCLTGKQWAAGMVGVRARAHSNIGIFGVEVEFQPQTDPATSNPAPPIPPVEDVKKPHPAGKWFSLSEMATGAAW